MATITDECIPPVLWTCKQAAQRLGLSPSFVYNKLIVPGKLRSIRIAKHARRIPESELQAWIQRKLAEQYGEGADRAGQA